MAGARNSGGWPEDGNSLELGVINLNVHFFFLWVRVLCFTYTGEEDLEGSFNSRPF